MKVWSYIFLINDYYSFFRLCITLRSNEFLRGYGDYITLLVLYLYIGNDIVFLL